MIFYDLTSFSIYIINTIVIYLVIIVSKVTYFMNIEQNLLRKYPMKKI
jgi:hypothetical protein